MLWTNSNMLITLYFVLLGATIVWKGDRQSFYTSSRECCQDQWISGWSLWWPRWFCYWSFCNVTSTKLSKASKHTESFTIRKPGVSGTCWNITICSPEETYEVSLSEHRNSSQEKVRLTKSRLCFHLLRACLGWWLSTRYVLLVDKKRVLQQCVI